MQIKQRQAEARPSLRLAQGEARFAAISAVLRETDL